MKTKKDFTRSKTSDNNVTENENVSNTGANFSAERNLPDIKECFAQNLIHYRKALNYTQAELAEKLNYSDKAVSKWERAESVPDIYTVKSIADFFGTDIDTLISEPKPDKPKFIRNLGKKRTIICLASAAIVWLVAIMFFAFIHILLPNIQNTWLSFIYALPITAIVLLVFTSVWGKSLGNVIILSLLVWTVILTVYLTVFTSLNNPPENLWEMFLIGIPAQGVIIFWYLYKKVK